MMSIDQDESPMPMHVLACQVVQWLVKNNRVSLEIVDRRNGHVDLPYFVDLKKWTCNLQ
jgi:hypothetical protein